MCVKRVQRSTIDKKIYLSTHPRKIGYDVSVLRPSVHSLGVKEGNQVSARWGRSMMYFLGRKSCDAFVEPSCDHCHRVQKLVYFKDFVTVTVEKIVMATNNSGSNSTYLLISREEELSGE